MEKESLKWKTIVSAVIFILVSVSFTPSIYANESKITVQSQSQLLKSIYKEFRRNPLIRKIVLDTSKILQLHLNILRKDMRDIHLTHLQLANILKLLFAFNTVDFSDIHSQLSYSDKTTSTYEQVFDGVDDNQMDALSHKFMILLRPQFEEISAIISHNLGFDVTAFEWDFPILCPILVTLTLIFFGISVFFGLLYLDVIALLFLITMAFFGMLAEVFGCINW